MNTGKIIKIVLLSSLCAVFFVLSLGFVFRTEITHFLLANVSPDAIELAQEKETPNQMEFLSVPEVVAKANPAVLSIIATKDVPVYEQYYEEVSPFGGMFGEVVIPRIREYDSREQEVGGGSGFIVSADGLVVTNRHVVDESEAKYTARLSDGQTYPVEVIDRDDLLDIAILKINSEEELPHLTFANLDEIKLGEPVVAIGNALAEFNNTVSSGIISGLSRTISAQDSIGRFEQLDGVIQTDAAINPGNSGGPLLNKKGNVVGVNVATSLGAQNIGFALPADVVEAIVRSVGEYGEIRRPYLGVRYTIVDQSVADSHNLPLSYGALVLAGGQEPAVEPNSPAEEAGIQEGDLIVSINERQLKNISLATALRVYKPGDEIELTLFRNGEELTVSVVLSRL